jgi:hypothetical protein
MFVPPGWRYEVLYRCNDGTLGTALHGPTLRRGEAAAREADELNDLHQAEIALAHANVVNCDMAATALHKAVMSGGSGGGAQSGGVDDA